MREASSGLATTRRLLFHDRRRGDEHLDVGEADQRLCGASFEALAHASRSFDSFRNEIVAGR
jgi:hypothetical protein